MRQLLENWATYNSNIWYTADYPNFRIWLTSSGARCRSSRSFRPTAIHVDRSCRKPFFNGDKSYNQTLTRLKTREMEQRTPTTLIHTVAANCEIFFLHQFFPLKVDSYTTKMHHVAADCCGAERWNGIYRVGILEHFLPISKQTPKPSASIES